MSKFIAFLCYWICLLLTMTVSVDFYPPLRPREGFGDLWDMPSAVEVFFTALIPSPGHSQFPSHPILVHSKGAVHPAPFFSSLPDCFTWAIRFLLQGFRSTNWRLRNSHGDVKCSVETIVSDVATTRYTAGWVLDWSGGSLHGLYRCLATMLCTWN